MAVVQRVLPVLHDRVRARRFDSLFLFVTSRCNSLCRTCFYFDKLNSRDDLTFTEIDRLSQTAPPFHKLWISGGEPFMRKELAEILILFVRRNGVRSVNLPTNGLLPEKIFSVIEKVLAACPDVQVGLNFSLDGLADTHDVIRGVPNNFVRTLATVREAEKRYGSIRRLRRNVVSVITSENYHELVALARQLMENEDVNGHYFEVVRGEIPDPKLKALTSESLAELHKRLMPVHRHYAKRLFAHLPTPARQFATMYYLGNVRFHFDLHERCFEQPNPWPMPCTAGETSIVIDHNGAFRACELRRTLGSLHEFDLNVQAALSSEVMRKEIAAIPGDKCWCTHSCFIHDSSRFKPTVQFLSIPWAYLKQRWRQLPAASLSDIEQFKAPNAS
jgi:Fe-coproporphyrin III synthase